MKNDREYGFRARCTVCKNITYVHFFKDRKKDVEKTLKCDRCCGKQQHVE